MGGLRLKAPKTKTSARDVGLPEIVVEALREHRKRQLEQRLALGLGRADDALLFPTLTGSLRGPRAFGYAPAENETDHELARRHRPMPGRCPTRSLAARLA